MSQPLSQAAVRIYVYLEAILNNTEWPDIFDAHDNS